MFDHTLFFSTQFATEKAVRALAALRRRLRRRHRPRQHRPGDGEDPRRHRPVRVSYEGGYLRIAVIDCEPPTARLRATARPRGHRTTTRRRSEMGELRHISEPLRDIVAGREGTDALPRHPDAVRRPRLADAADRAARETPPRRRVPARRQRRHHRPATTRRMARAAPGRELRDRDRSTRPAGARHRRRREGAGRGRRRDPQRAAASRPPAAATPTSRAPTPATVSARVRRAQRPRLLRALPAIDPPVREGVRVAPASPADRSRPSRAGSPARARRARRPGDRRRARRARPPPPATSRTSRSGCLRAGVTDAAADRRAPATPVRADLRAASPRPRPATSTGSRNGRPGRASPTANAPSPSSPRTSAGAGRSRGRDRHRQARRSATTGLAGGGRSRRS